MNALTQVHIMYGWPGSVGSVTEESIENFGFRLTDCITVENSAKQFLVRL